MMRLVLKAGLGGVPHPGARGGQFYYDEHGKVQYGDPPAGAREVEEETQRARARAEVRAEFNHYEQRKRRRDQRRGELVAAALKNTAGLVKETRSDGRLTWYMIHRDTYPKSPGWRVTVFRHDGVYGHHVGATPEQALEDADVDVERSEPGDVAEFEEISHSEKFSTGNRNARLIQVTNTLGYHGRHEDSLELNRVWSHEGLDAAEAAAHKYMAQLRAAQPMAKALLEVDPVEVVKEWCLKAQQLGLFSGPRKPVQSPGSRGGKFYFTEAGGVRYGTPPTSKWTTERPTEGLRTFGNFGIFGHRPSRASKRGRWLVYEGAADGDHPVQEFTRGWIAQSGAVFVEKVRNSPRALQVLDDQGNVVAESPSWRIRGAGKIAAIPTETGFIASYTDQAGTEHYSADRYPHHDLAFAAARDLKRYYEGPPPEEIKAAQQAAALQEVRRTHTMLDQVKPTIGMRVQHYNPDFGGAATIAEIDERGIVYGIYDGAPEGEAPRSLGLAEHLIVLSPAPTSTAPEPLLKTWIGSARAFLKAHVGPYARTSKKTGKTATVTQHERTQQRYATVHIAGPESPGHTVRLASHREKPGVWTIHPEDRERVRKVLGINPGTKAGHRAFLMLRKKEREKFGELIQELHTADDPALRDFARGWGIAEHEKLGTGKTAEDIGAEVRAKMVAKRAAGGKT